jgi:hypothetical protein
MKSIPGVDLFTTGATVNLPGCASTLTWKTDTTIFSHHVHNWENPVYISVILDKI